MCYQTPLAITNLLKSEANQVDNRIFLKNNQEVFREENSLKTALNKNQQLEGESLFSHEIS